MHVTVVAAAVVGRVDGRWFWPKRVVVVKNRRWWMRTLINVCIYKRKLVQILNRIEKTYVVALITGPPLLTQTLYCDLFVDIPPRSPSARVSPYRTPALWYPKTNEMPAPHPSLEGRGTRQQSGICVVIMCAIARINHTQSY